MAAVDDGPGRRRRRASGEDARADLAIRRDTYLKIKCKIKHRQKLKLNIFPAKSKLSLDKKFSKFDKKVENVFVKICEILGLERCKGFLNLVDLNKF